jgi:hypothetical protein
LFEILNRFGTGDCMCMSSYLYSIIIWPLKLTSIPHGHQTSASSSFQ